MPLAVFRNMGYASFQYAARRGMPHQTVKDVDFPAFQRQQTGQSIDQLGLAIPLHACHSQHFPCAHIKRHSVDGHVFVFVLNVQILDLQHHFFWFSWFFLDHQVDFPSHHHGCQFLRRGLCRGNCSHHPAAAQHGDMVRNCHDLFQLMRNEDN